MAEYDYLNEEIDISGDLIPCEFCSDLFPISLLIEHSSGCRPEIFWGSGKPDKVPQESMPPPVSLTNWDKKVLSSEVNETPSIKIEQLVRNDIFDIRLKNDSCFLERISDSGSAKTVTTDASSHYVRYRTNIHEQDDIESDDDEGQFSTVGSEQAKATFSSPEDSIQNLHMGTDDSLDLSDDNNDDNESIESFLLRASLELNKIKGSLHGARPKWQRSKFKDYNDEEEVTYQCHKVQSLKSHIW